MHAYKLQIAKVYLLQRWVQEGNRQLLGVRRIRWQMTAILRLEKPFGLQNMQGSLAREKSEVKLTPAVEPMSGALHGDALNP
jgi:hypothetical protein